MDGHTIGLFGGLCGGVVGIIGGVAGTYFSIRNARTPALRRWVGRVAVWLWLGIFAMTASQFVLPVPWRWLAWIPYAAILPVAIHRLNQRYRALFPSERST